MIPPANYEVFQLTGYNTGSGIFTFQIPYGYAGRKAHIKLLHFFTEAKQGSANESEGVLLLATNGLRGTGLRTFNKNMATGAQVEVVSLGISPMDSTPNTHYAPLPQLDCQITGETITIETRDPEAPQTPKNPTGKIYLYLEIKFANGKYGEEMPESAIHQ